MSEKVGTRSFKEEEQDAGIGFVRVNDVSPSMQEMIDLEIKRIMQVNNSNVNRHYSTFLSLIGII
jgi:hypothetical protein